MDRKKEITSTERLLKLIRSKREDLPEISDPAEQQETRKGEKRPALAMMISLQKTCTVGIDIGHDYLRLVRATETSAGKWRVDARKRLAIPLKTPKESPEFGAFLKGALAAICGPAKRANLWVIMSAAHVEVRNIRIPKVAKKQISNVVYWTARKEAPFDEKETVFDYEVQGEVVDQGINKLAVMFYTAPRQEIENLKGIFSRIGRPLAGISIVPFSLQNLFRAGWISAREGAVASLFIGNDFSRIDVYGGANLVMTRGIKAGLSSMVEALADAFNEYHRFPGGPTLTFDQGRKIVQSLSADSLPLGENDVGFFLTKEEIFQMIKPALERLTRQVERTFEHYAVTMPGDRISRIFVSGAMNISMPVIEYVGSQLGVTSEVLDPLNELDQASCTDAGDTECLSERIAFGAALGLAFSGNDHTPNLIFPYKDKETAAAISRINMAVFMVFIITVFICSGVFLFQNHAIAEKKRVIAGLESRVLDLGPAVDRNQLLKMAAMVSDRRRLSKLYAERYLAMVLMSELIELTPGKIKFIDLKINLGTVPGGSAVPGAGGTPALPAGIAAALPSGPPGAGNSPTADAANQPGEAPKASQREIILEGLVLGERQLLETSLAGYVIALEASPFFRQVTVQRHGIEPFIKGEALHFIIKLTVEGQVNG